MHDVISAATLKVAELTFSQFADIPSYILHYLYLTIGQLTISLGI
jgi:hypothetical protein